MNEEIAVNVSTVLLTTGAVVFTPQSPVTFKSGIKSPVYVDNRIVPFYPDRWQVIIDSFKQTIADANLQFNVIAGIETSGIPHSAALAYDLKIPSIYVRKANKEHGQQNRIEGGRIEGQHVLLVEDMVTTGGSSLDGVKALREEGATVTDCLAITTYGLHEATDAFAEANVTLHSMTDFPMIWRTAQHKITLTLPILRAVEAWLQDPHGWESYYVAD